MKDNIGQYKVSRILGRGGMGAVYLAKDILLDRDVAIKTIQSHMSTSSDRFYQEARILAKLNHPNIASIYNLVSEDEELYMIMEYIKGISLEDLIKAKSKLNVPQAKTIFGQVLQGLQHAHHQGTIHRDIKSSNVMINEEGVAKLMDFGIAVSSGNERYTKTGNILGTLEYISPEIIKGEQPSTQSDIYAMGILLYEMVSGRTPFQGTNEYALINAHMQQKPPELGSDVPSSLKKVIKRCLAKSTNKRYKTIGEVLSDLQQVQDEDSSPLSFQSIELQKKLPNINLKLLYERYKNQFLVTASALVIIICMALLIPKINNQRDDNNGISAQKTEITKKSGPISEPVKMATKDPRDLRIGELIYEGRRFYSNNIYINGNRNLWIVCKEILQLDPNHTQANSWVQDMINYFMREGSNALNNDQLSEAQQLFESVLLIDPNHQGAKNELLKIKKRYEALNKAKTTKKTTKRTIKPINENSKKSKNKEEIKAKNEENPPAPIEVKEFETKGKEVKKEEISENKKKESSTSLKNKRKRVSVSIPKNKDILIAVVETISSKNNYRKGQSIKLSVLKDVYINGILVIQQGAIARGTLENFKSSKNNQKGLIELKVKQVQTIDGTWIAVKRGNFKIPGDKGEEIKFTPSTKLQVKTSKSTNISAYQ